MTEFDPNHEGLATALRAAFTAAPEPDARAHTRARLLAAPPPARRSRPLHRRLVVPIAATFFALSATSAIAVPLASHALPGDALHGIRMAGERIRIVLADADDEAQVRLAIAQARTADIERALARGRDDALAELARRFFEQLTAADTLRGHAPADRSTRIAALIATQRARFDAITARQETTAPGQDRGRKSRIIHDLRKHDDRADDTDTGQPNHGTTRADRDKGYRPKRGARPRSPPSSP